MPACKSQDSSLWHSLGVWLLSCPEILFGTITKYFDGNQDVCPECDFHGKLRREDWGLRWGLRPRHRIPLLFTEES